MNRSRRFRRPLRFEGLEERCLMAGNISVALTLNTYGEHDLLITGDNNANQIEIQWIEDFFGMIGGSVGPLEMISIIPRDNETVNGNQTGAHYVLSAAVTGDVIVKLHGGNDVLLVKNFVAHQGLHIDAGAGNDDITVQNSTIKDDLIIYAGAGQDKVTISDVTIGGFGVSNNRNNLLVDLGKGTTTAARDEVSLNNVSVHQNATLELGAAAIKDATLFQSEVGRDLTIRSDHGFTGVNLIDSTIGRHANIDTGFGIDYVSLLDTAVHGALGINTSAGDDRVTIARSSVRGNVSIDTGQGDDLVTIAHVTMGNLFVNLGDGNDTLLLSKSSVRGDVSIEAGQGNDLVEIAQLTMGNRLDVSLGDGNDTLSIKDSKAKKAFLVLSDQFDTLSLFNNQFDFWIVLYLEN